jgi:SlyX protein
MTDDDSEQRLIAMEMRIAFQDDAIETLNKAITDQWSRIDALTRQLAELRDRLREAETVAPGGEEAPPPHY